MMRRFVSRTTLVAVIASWLSLACASDPHERVWSPPDPASPPPGSPVALHGQLKVVGTQLVDQNGVPIQLKGASSMWLGQGTPYAESKKALAFMRDNWALSVIRGAMGADSYQSDTQAAPLALEQIVQNAIDLGVYVLVDWHTEQAVIEQDKAQQYFGAMAGKYGAYPNVIWETYNEPARYSWAEIKQYHEAVIPVIRAVDPDNLIVLGTPNYSQNVDEAAQDPVIGENLLYTLHFYSCSHQQWLRSKGDVALAAGLALFVTEFGATFYDGGLVSSNHDYVCEDETNLWFAWMAQGNAAQSSISGVAWKLESCTDSSCILGPDAPLNGPWPDRVLSTDVGGALSPSGTGIKGGQGLFVVNWLRQ
jgi:endoglucanase